MRMPLFSRKIMLSHFLRPGFFIRKLYGNNLLYLPEDLAWPAPEVLKKLAIASPKPVTPYKIGFGITRHEVKRLLGPPIVYITDDVYFKEHCVLVYKRMIGPYRTTTQVHLFKNKVQIVVEEIKKLYIPDTILYPKVLDQFGYHSICPPNPTSHSLILTDSQENILFALWFAT